MKSIQTNMDRTAIGLSLLCTAHCLLLPALMVVPPAMTVASFGEEWFHRLLLVAVVPTSLVALTMGCRRHGNRHVLWAGLSGLVILAMVALLGHGVLSEPGERITTVTGAALIAVGHWKNHRLCRSARCACQSSTNA